MAKEVLNKFEETWERTPEGYWVDEWGNKDDLIALRDLVINSNLSNKTKKRIGKALKPWVEAVKNTSSETVVKAIVVKCTPNNNVAPFIRLAIRVYDNTNTYRWNAPLNTYDAAAVDADPSLLNPSQNSTWVAD